MSESQLSELGSETAEAYSTYCNDKNLYDVACAKYEEGKELARNASSEIFDIDPIENPTGIGEHLNNIRDSCSRGTMKCAYAVADAARSAASNYKDVPIIGKIADAVVTIADTVVENTVNRQMSSLNSHYTAAQSTYKNSYDNVNAVAQNDEAVTSYMETGKTPNEEKRSKTFSTLFIIIAIIAAIIIVILLIRRRPRHARPVTVQAPPTPQRSGDINLDYNALLRKMCQSKGRDYNEVLQSFGGDARKACEALRVS